MAEHQQALAAAILKDPDVVSLSSFIGVDGTNTTLNSGRFLINLKPRDERSRRCERRSSGACSAETADVAGITLYMQPVQDLTIDATVSATQYQFVLEDADPDAVRRVGAEAARSACSKSPSIADVASDDQQGGLAAYVTIDRATAARFGITPATVDNALYDAFGQRIVSTIFTQSNQYRVILEADPAMQQSLRSLSSIYLPSSTAAPSRPGAALGDRHRARAPAPLQISHLGQFPPTTISFNLAPGASLGAAVEAIEQAERRSACRPASSPASRARRWRSRRRSATSCS